MTDIRKWSVNFPIDNQGRITFSAIMIAPRRSGKTTFIKWLIEEHLFDKFDLVFVFTTANGIEEYSSHVDPRRIYSRFIPEIPETIRIINASAKLRENGQPANVLMIIDDSCSRKQKFDAQILDLFTKGRHFNISIIYSVQTATLVDNIWKENSDFIFIFKQKTAVNKLYVVNNVLAGMLDVEFDSPTKERNFYRAVLKKITTPEHQMMVVDMWHGNILHFKSGLPSEESILDEDDDSPPNASKTINPKGTLAKLN